METLRLTYDSSISDIREVNSSFDIGTLQICYPGENRNKTYFSKLTLENGVPTIFNCPVVCHYYRDGSIGGHDVEVITDYDNQLRMVNLTQPVGVIPESAKVYFKNVEEDDGTIHEYLCADVILWKRQEAYKALKENGITAQSMEINVKDGAQLDDIYVINDFEFTAFALLGDCEPCFESASLQTFSLGSEFKEQFAMMMDEFKETFNLQATSSEVDDTKQSKKGGCEVQDNNLEKLEAEVDEVTDTGESVNDETSVETDESFALNSNISEEIYAAFTGLTISTEWGTREQYIVTDYDVDSKMVYVWDTSDWLLYGFSYDMDGDKVNVDFNSKKRMKYVIAEFDEGDVQASPFFSVCEQMSTAAVESNEKYADLEERYREVCKDAEDMDVELKELRQYKKDIEDATDKAQRDELFARFADLNDIEEFAALVADSSDYDMDALEEKCFAIRGRNMKLNFSKNESKAPKLIVTHNERQDEEEPYGGVVKRYCGE